MAGADYDYTKSLLPAGNGTIHAMSGGGRGVVQEGGVLGNDTGLRIFDFDSFGIDKEDTNILFPVKDGDKDNIGLKINREILRGLFTRIESIRNNKVIQELLTNYTREYTITIKVKKSNGNGNVLYNISSTLMSMSNITNDSVDKTKKTFNYSLSRYLVNIFNNLFDTKKETIITIKFNKTEKEIKDFVDHISKKVNLQSVFIPYITEITNLTTFNPIDYSTIDTFLKDNINKPVSDLFSKPIPSSTTSPRDFEKEAAELIKGMPKYEKENQVLTTNFLAHNERLPQAQKYAIEPQRQAVMNAYTNYHREESTLRLSMKDHLTTLPDSEKQAFFNVMVKEKEKLPALEAILKTAMDALRAAMGGSTPPPPPPPPGDHEAQVKAIIDAIKNFDTEIADLKTEADKYKGDTTIDTAVAALDAAKTAYDTAVTSAQTKAAELTTAADDAAKDKVVADLTALQPGIAAAQPAVEAAMTALRDAVVAAGGAAGAAAAATTAAKQDITISFGSKNYDLQIPVDENDFTTLDEPGKEALKEIFYDFGLDLIKDNKNAAAFVNGLAECHSILNSIDEPKCAIVKVVAAEVLKKIVSYDIPGATPPPSSGMAAMASGSATPTTPTTTPTPSTSLWTCSTQPAPVDYSKLPDLTAGAQPPAASLYAIWINPTTKKTHLLIHKRSQTVTGEKGMISTPGGSVDDKESYPEAAAREASEEAGYKVNANELRAFSIPPPPAGVTTEQNKVYFYHVVESDTVPTVNGPSNPKFASEMDQTFDFAGIDGEVAGTPATPTYHFWAEIIPLLRWLETNPTSSGTIYHQVKDFLLPYLCMTDTSPTTGSRDFAKEAADLVAEIKSLDGIITKLENDMKGKSKETDHEKALNEIVSAVMSIPEFNNVDKFKDDASDPDTTKAESAVKELRAIFEKLQDLEPQILSLQTAITANTGTGTGSGSKTSVKKGKTKGIFNFTGLACYFVTAIQFLNNIDELREAILSTDPNDIGTTPSSKEYLDHTNLAEYEKKIQLTDAAKLAWRKEWYETFGSKKTKPAKKEAKKTFGEKEAAYLEALLQLKINPAKYDNYKKVITKEFIRTAIIVLKKGKDYIPDADKTVRDTIIKELKDLFKAAPIKEEQDKKIFTGDESVTYTEITNLYNDYQTSKIIANKALEDNYGNDIEKKSFIDTNFTSKIADYQKEISDIKSKQATDPNFGKTKIKESFQALKTIFAQLNDDTIDLSTEKAATDAKIVENFEKIRQFTPGTAKGCSQEDSQEFIIKIIFPLIQCYSNIDKIINEKFIISKDTTRTCRDDKSIKKVSSEIMSFLKLEYDGATETTVDNLLKTTKTSGWTESLEACNDLADADADDVTEVNIPDTNKYILIQISRAAGPTGVAGVSIVAVKPNYELTIDGKKYMAVSTIVRSTSTSASSGHYVMQVLKKDDTTGFAVTDYELNDGRVVNPPDVFLSLDKGGLVYLYKRKDPMTGGSRQRHTMGKTMRTTSKAVSEQRRTLKARGTSVIASTSGTDGAQREILKQGSIASTPSLARTKRRHLKARTTQSRTERSRVSGRLPIRRAGGK